MSCRRGSDDEVLVAALGQLFLVPVCAQHADDVRFGDHPALPEFSAGAGLVLRLGQVSS